MPPPPGAIEPSERPRRRKISLACEPCRERKSRCDGGKPICVACTRRGLDLEQCVYKAENARSAGTKEYIHALHSRIRALEDQLRQQQPASSLPSQLVNSSGENQGSTPDPSHRHPSTTTFSTCAVGNLTGSNQAQPGTSPREPGLDRPTPNGPLQVVGDAPLPDARTCELVNHARNTDTTTGLRRTSHSSSQDTTSSQRRSAQYRPSHGINNNPEVSNTHDLESGITAMGTAMSEIDLIQSPVQEDQFYGNSSAASFIRESYNKFKSSTQFSNSIKNATIKSMPSDFGATCGSASEHVRQWKVADFSLPPRPVADQLIDNFFQKIFCLYPIFHRPTFEAAYRSLWESDYSNPSNLDERRSTDHLGLGSPSDAPANTSVFHCALNAIFAVSCHFLDTSVTERTTAARTFFLRSRALLDLDFLEANNLGVIQTLLVMVLFLQSTPFPRRCWTSIGIACRLAQSFGLHSEAGSEARSQLENEIRRRLWHGCVMLDMTVSMTFGRPTMTTHACNVELPLCTETPDTLENNLFMDCNEPRTLVYFIESIRLSTILEEILITMYRPWSSRTLDYERNCFNLDTISKLDSNLRNFEKSVPVLLSWTTPKQVNVSISADKIIGQQTNVLHARFLYVRLMLYRPILSELVASQRLADDGSVNFATVSAANPLSVDDGLRSSFIAQCGRVCIKCAMELVDLIHMTVQKQLSSSSWWDTLYLSTSGLVIILALASPVLRPLVEPSAVQASWRSCQATMEDLAQAWLPARKLSGLLQSVYHRLCNNATDETGQGQSEESSAIANETRHSVGPQLQSNDALHPMVDLSTLMDLDFIDATADIWNGEDTEKIWNLELDFV